LSATSLMAKLTPSTTPSTLCLITVDPNSESGGFYSAGAYGSIGLDGEVSVEFADLTEALVVEWVKTALGGEEKVAEIEAALQNQIDLKITPVSAAGVPW
jgi:hypothetical protein